jgi:hypothetical protein
MALLFVDAELRASTAILDQLSIVNPDPLRLGGKGIGPWNDRFRGLLERCLRDRRLGH